MNLPEPQLLGDPVDSIGQTKLFKQYLHQRLTFASYSVGDQLVALEFHTHTRRPGVTFAQTVIPVQGYVQLRPHDTTLPSFGGGPPATAGTANETIPTEVAIREGGGKASPSVSIFSRAPLCPNTCRHCRNKPCDIATDHDDHICYNCEQRLLFPERIRSGRRRSCPFATYGAWSVLLNDAALGTLINITYACSVNDEELFSSPPLGARTHGLPMMTDWMSLSACCGPIHTDVLCNGE